MMQPGDAAVAAAVTAQVTFGRDGAMFEGLLGFVAQLSLVLWSVVTLTVVIRFVGIRFYRRAARRALARIKAADAELAGPGAHAPAGARESGHGEPRKTAGQATAPAIAVVPVMAAGLDLLQPENVPPPAAFAKVLATNPADG